MTYVESTSEQIRAYIDTRDQIEHVYHEVPRKEYTAKLIEILTETWDSMSVTGRTFLFFEYSLISQGYAVTSDGELIKSDLPQELPEGMILMEDSDDIYTRDPYVAEMFMYERPGSMSGSIPFYRNETRKLMEEQTGIVAVFWTDGGMLWHPATGRTVEGYVDAHSVVIQRDHPGVTRPSCTIHRRDYETGTEWGAEVTKAFDQYWELTSRNLIPIKK